MNDSSSAATPSPCINICRMNQSTGLCEGCLRTLDEIALWAQASDPQKRAILAQLAGRRETADFLALPLERQRS